MDFVNKFGDFYTKRKEYWSIIVILPTLFGGFWQLLELFLVDPSFIRFFSVSQMIPDGLLILFILLLFICSIYIPVRMLGGRKILIAEDKGEVKISLWNIIGAAFLIFFSVYTLYQLWKILDYPSTISAIKVNHLFIITFAVVLCLPLFIIGSKGLIQEIILLLPDKGRKLKIALSGFFVKKVDDKVVPTRELLYFSLILIISFIFIVLAFIITFRNQIINPKQIINFDIFMRKIDSENGNATQMELLYFNDKYIFLRAKPKIGIESNIHLLPIKIYKMDDVLFTKD